MVLNNIRNIAHWIFIIIYLFIIISCNLCTNIVIDELNLPYTSYKVIIFERDCGATTATSLQLSIVSRTEKLQNYNKGNICITDGNKLTCDILPNDIILIRYTGRLFLAKDSYENIRIIYEEY